jgi:hypothetical protein
MLASLPKVSRSKLHSKNGQSCRLLESANAEQDHTCRKQVKCFELAEESHQLKLNPTTRKQDSMDLKVAGSLLHKDQ